MEQRTRLLVLGGNGQIGWELRRALLPLGEVVAPSREECDLERPDNIDRVLELHRPDVIVNAAAYTAVDQAEDEVVRAHHINATAPAALARHAAHTGALLVHYSTDYVFDGMSRYPYGESDPVAPLNVYGETKLAGEEAIRKSDAAHLIVRTSWVYGARGNNFLRAILRLSRERDTLRVVNDQTGAPTWSRAVAEATAMMVAARVRAARANRRFDRDASDSGIYHVAAAGACTWHEFASAILDADPARAEQRCTSVEPIATEEYGARARRPAYSVLDCSRVERDFGIALPHWQAQLALLLEELASAQ